MSPEKKNITFVTIFSMLSLMNLAHQSHAAIILTESFETDGEGTRYTSTGVFTDGADDYFIRTDGETEASGIPQYDGISGNYFWAIEDSETTDNSSSVSQILFSGIDISTTSLINFSLDIGAGSTGAFDLAEDYFKLEYQVDNTGWLPAFAFYNDGATFNSMLRLDTDNNGIGEGTILTPTFQSFISDNINVSGSSLDLRIDTWMTGGNEAVGFDNIQVASVPEPKYFALIFSCLAAVPFLQVLRKKRALESRA